MIEFPPPSGELSGSPRDVTPPWATSPSPAPPADTALGQPGTTARRRPALRPVAARGLRRGGLFGAGIAAALVAVLAYNAVVPSNQVTSDDVQAAIASALASVTPPPPAAEVVYQEIAPSFVIVQAAEAAASGAPGASAGPAASPNASGAPGGSGVLGSGVIVNSQGEILTALHVVADASAIEVTFADGSSAAATIVTREPASDIAVLQATELPASAVPATLGNPRSVRIGDDAYIVGNPFGLAGSISAGVVSGLDRSFRAPGSGQELTGLIQVDAAVNPGNSGGPLVNRDGQVIGIVTGLVNPTGQNVFIGIGLAVPIDVAGGAAGLPPD